VSEILSISCCVAIYRLGVRRLDGRGGMGEVSREEEEMSRHCDCVMDVVGAGVSMER
jgi:hypothetical protein